MEATEWSFDDLGRVTRVTAADGAQTNTVYANELVTVSDPASVTKTQKSDALGQLVEVTEAGNEVTAYSYNPLGLLAQVTQQNVTWIRQRRTNELGSLHNGASELLRLRGVPKSGNMEP